MEKEIEEAGKTETQAAPDEESKLAGHKRQAPEENKPAPEVPESLQTNVEPQLILNEGWVSAIDCK